MFLRFGRFGRFEAIERFEIFLEICVSLEIMDIMETR